MQRRWLHCLLRQGAPHLCVSHGCCPGQITRLRWLSSIGYKAKFFWRREGATRRLCGACGARSRRFARVHRCVTIARFCANCLYALLSSMKSTPCAFAQRRPPQGEMRAALHHLSARTRTPIARAARYAHILLHTAGGQVTFAQVSPVYCMCL